MLTKRIERKLDKNCTRMLRPILNKSWLQHPTKQQLYRHLPPISKNIKIRRARHAAHDRRSKSELISDVLCGPPSNGRAKVERPARTYLQQLFTDTGCSMEDQLKAMDDRNEWRDRVNRDNITWWSFTGVWVTASLLKSPRIPSILWPIVIMM